MGPNGRGASTVRLPIVLFEKQGCAELVLRGSGLPRQAVGWSPGRVASQHRKGNLTSLRMLSRKVTLGLTLKFASVHSRQDRAEWAEGNARAVR